jgi:hypothetical protein
MNIIKAIILGFCLVTQVHAKGIFDIFDINEESLQSDAIKANKELPIVQPGGGQVLESVTAGPGLRLTYNFTWVKDYKRSVNKGYSATLSKETIAGFMQELTPINKSAFCTTNARVYPDHGVTGVYSYKFFDGTFMGEIVITPEDCKALYSK